MADLRIQVLGPTALWRAGDRLDLGPAGRRAAFGLLVLASSQALSVREIAAGLWLERPPPPTAENVIQTYVKHLRRLLEPDRPRRAASTVLRRVGDGYTLHLPVEAVDVLRFRRLVAAATAAQRCGRFENAAESLSEALALWQGPPLADIPALAGHPKIVALAEERNAALARYGEVMLAAGRAADGLPALEEAAAAQPLNEAWQARLIRAYQATGRRSLAFATFHGVRRRLAEDLGVDPGPELTDAHSALLHSGESPDAAIAVPAQLPADTRTFVGRAAELSQLDHLLAGPDPSAVVVVSGAPGIGKTALAVHWVHRIAPRFPDGQLYLNLRGFDPDGIVVEPNEVIWRILDALGVPAERIPATVDGRAALYRSLLAGRRMLIVLDNARDVAQVRPLLPGAPGCTVLITARHQLAGLIAAEGAQPLTLGPLAAAEAQELLVRRVGRARTAAEPGAVHEIVERCAGLPLALVIIAARAALNGTQPLGALADQVRRNRDRLDALTTGDPGTDLRAVFSWSYDALTPAAARLFGLLGLHAGPDISVPAAASLAALTTGRVRGLLTELVRAGLATEPTVGRYCLHDLVRTYAADVVVRAGSARTRRAASLRMLDHYLHSAYAADRIAHPACEAYAPGPPVRGVTPETAADARTAKAWLAAERAVLVAAVERAASVSHRRAWQLARALSAYLDLRGHWDDLATTQHTAIAAARDDADPRAQAGAHRLLARAYTRLHRIDDAYAELSRALDLCLVAGDLIGQGHTHLNLSLLWERQERYPEALAHARQGLATFLTAGDDHGIARALNAVGWYHALLGDYPVALDHCRDALARLEKTGDRLTVAATLDSLGYVQHHLGEYALAIAAYRRSVELYRDLGDSHLEAFVRVHLGDTYDARGDGPAARTLWCQALEVLDRCDPPEAGKIRARLASVPVNGG